MGPRVFSGLLAASLLLLACSQNVTQTTNVVLPSSQPARSASPGGFGALGGAGLDPTILRHCGGETIGGDQGYARSMSRQYRQHLEKLIKLTGGGAADTSGSIYGADVDPSARPTAQPTSTAMPSTQPTSQPSTPLASATSDISVVEKTTFNGRILDPSGAPIDGVTVTARSLNSSVPYSATSSTAGGFYAFNNAPSGVQIEIIVSKPGFAPRRRVEVLKSNKEGDPNANKFDFGAGTGSLGTDANALTDRPEVVLVSPARNGTIDNPNTQFNLRFSEPMDRASVEQNIALFKRQSGFQGELLFDVNAFNASWNSDDTELTLTFKAGTQLERQQSYLIGFKSGTIIKDKTGISRSENYFKLTEGDYEPASAFNLLSFMLAQASAEPKPLPPVTKVRDQYYFSYDDSASVGSVELVKHALEANQLPKPEWARTWEFLNYEPFDHLAQESTGLLKVSLGLWKYRHLDNPLLDTYEIGAHVTSPYRCKATRPNLNLTVVIDSSGSMNEPAALATGEGAPLTKLELVKQAIKDLSGSLRAGDIVNVMSFANKPVIELENYVVGSDSEQKYLALADTLKPAGGTNLQSAVDEGYRLAQKNFDAKKMNRLLLMTDAKTTEGNLDVVVIRQKAKLNDSRGIYLSALGIGHDHDQDLLNRITDAGRGAYYTLQTRADVREAMGDRFIPLMDVVARNARFKLEFPGWLRHGKTAAEQISKDPAKVQPTNFSANSSQYFWEQFKANRTDFQGDETVKLTISYEDPLTGTPKTEVIEKTLSEMLDKDLGNLKAAHLVQLTTSLIKGETRAADVRRELDELLPDVGK